MEDFLFKTEAGSYFSLMRNHSHTIVLAQMYIDRLRPVKNIVTHIWWNLTKYIYSYSVLFWGTILCYFILVLHNILEANIVIFTSQIQIIDTKYDMDNTL